MLEERGKKGGEGRMGRREVWEGGENGRMGEWENGMMGVICIATIVRVIQNDGRQKSRPSSH